MFLLTDFGSYTHWRKPEVAVFLRTRPVLLHVRVTFSLNGTRTFVESGRKTVKPSDLSSGRDTHLASAEDTNTNETDY
jgi:hypothetical protein